jgi:hypothetical protein
LVEDSVVGSGNGYDQVNAYNTQTGHPYAGAGNPIVGYPHRRVMRDILPNTWGDATVVPSNYALNTAYNRSFNTTIPTAFDDTKMSLVAVVSYFGGGDISAYEVINVEEVAMNTLITSIDENKTVEASFKVYPNPSTHLTNLTFQLNESKQVSIEVVDITGKRLIQEEMGQMVQGNQFVELDVSSLAEGFYFLNLRLDEKVITKKISIVR